MAAVGGIWVPGYHHVSRRTQFSSCDACRQSRVACDASKFGYQPGDAASSSSSWTGSCSRCAVRSRRCTFEWIKRTPRKQRHHSSGTQPTRSQTSSAIGLYRASVLSDLSDHRHLQNPHGSSYTGAYADTDDVYDTSDPGPPSEPFHLDSDAELVDLLLTRCVDTVFSKSLGNIFGRWVGRNGCPLVNEPGSEICMSPMKLFVELDSFMAEQTPPHPPFQRAATALSEPERDEQIDRCLRSAIQAYSARWLPLFLHTEPDGESVQCGEISKACWRAARKDMLKAINRPSYRSVLALYLFGQTPVPLGISPEEELDGISGLVCSQTALRQVQQLRERQRCCQFNSSEVSAWLDTATSTAATPNPNPNLTEEYLNFETRAYWATVTWDTSDSVTLNFRSTLSSGLKGACNEPVWQLARAFLVGSFHDRTQDWRKKGFRVSSDVAPQITSAASVCTIYTWRTIASLKEALREGVDEAAVELVWQSVLDAIDVFKTTIYPILSNCERQLHFLGQVDRLNWYEIVLLFYLGILILADALEAASRSDLLHQLTETNLEAEHECFNVLTFGLESTFSIPAGQNTSSSGSDMDFSAPSQQLAVSFVAIDPYPQHVVAAVMLMGKAFLRQYLQGSIKHEAYCHLASTLERALSQLPQNSKAVQSARNSMQELSTRYSLSECT